MDSASVRLLWQTGWTRKVTCFVSKFPALSHGAGYHLTPKRRQHFRYSSTPGSFARETPYPTYEYTNLPGRRWIRLLEIPALPGPNRAADTGMPLSCRLVNASIDKKPGYESSYDALSYSWDDQVSDRILHLRDETDGTPRQLFVTKNCEDAIRVLQRSLSLHREKPYRIWIDAISINQANLQERNSQVSMMEDIYGSAFCVRIWLGHATHDSYAAMRVLLRMASDKTLSPDKLPDIALKKSIDHLASRPYWQRIWTLQEVALAKGVVVHVGDERIHYWNLAKGAQQCDGMNYFRLGGHLLMWLKAKNELEDDGVAHRLTTLMMAQTKYSSEPRDKIYAVRPIMPDMFKDIVVDYGKSVQEVFTEGTRAVIENTESLEVLLFRSTTELSTTMPSWAVDWSNTDHLIQLIQQGAHLPIASATAPVRIAFSNDSQVLNIYGRVIGTIEHAGSPLSRKFDYKLKEDSMGIQKYLSSADGAIDILIIRLWIHAAVCTLQGQFPIHQIFARISKVLDPDNANSDDFDAWLRMTATDIYLADCSVATLDAAWQSKMPPEFEDELRSMLFPDYKGPLIELPIFTKILMNIVLDMKGDRRIITQHFKIIRRLGGQRFFITSEGCMGVGDANLEKGDRIMVFDGASFPMIVRSDGTKNVLIGPAKVPSLEIGALLEEGDLEAIQIS